MPNNGNISLVSFRNMAAMSNATAAATFGNCDLERFFNSVNATILVNIGGPIPKSWRDYH